MRSIVCCVAGVSDEFPVSFAIIVVAASFSFIVVICLLILASSSYRRCCRPVTLTSGRRAAVRSVSAAVLQPRLVGFTAVKRDHNKTTACTAHDRRQSATSHVDERGQQTEPTTSAKVNSDYKLPRQNDSTTPIRRCLNSRSVSVPAIIGDRTADHCHPTAADRELAEMTTAVASTRVDSGVSGMQSSLCTSSSSAVQQQQQPAHSSDEATDWTHSDHVDIGVDSGPVYHLSQLSMDVRSCPGGRTDDVTLLHPLFLCQYVNGYSDAMLMHAVDRQHSAWCPSDISLTTATQCANNDDQQSRGYDSVVSAARGALTVQTKAIVEPRPTASGQGASESPCFCGTSHDLPTTVDPDQPSVPSDIYCQSLDYMTQSAATSYHVPPPPSLMCCQPPDPALCPADTDCQCDPGGLRPDATVKTTSPTPPSELARRHLLARILLGQDDQLSLSPVNCEETEF